MSAIDTWTDTTVDVAVRLLRVGEMILRSYRFPATYPGVRPTTIDKWAADVNAFLEEAATHAEATADCQG